MATKMEVRISKTKPLQIQTSERSVFHCVWYTNVRYLSPHCTGPAQFWYSHYFYYYYYYYYCIVSFYPNLARRRTIAQGHNYHAVGKSKNIILSSEAQVKNYCYKYNSAHKSADVISLV